MEIIINAVLQIVYLTAPILICGLIIAGCSRLWLRLAGAGIGNAAIFITGVVGTPVHEIGHAAACLLFCHRITGIRFWSFDPTDGVLGYVRHTFNPHSVYQRIGNFFIAIAPILSGCAILLGGYYLLFGDIGEIYRAIPAGGVTAVGMFEETAASVGRMLKEFFSAEAVVNPLWWLYLGVGLCIALHINLGPDDFEGSGTGYFAFCIVILFVDFVLGLLGGGFLDASNRYFLIFNSYLCVFLFLAVLFSMMLVVFALIVCVIRSLFKKKECL